MELDNSLREAGLRLGVVVARGIDPLRPSAALSEALEALIAERAAQDFPGPERKAAVRALLRQGGFKPAGRNKPASEYLGQAAREGRFPRINTAVDICNLCSLESGLPISILDLAATGEALRWRLGGADEEYVFNSAGQSIRLSGLVVSCRAADDAALGNPVKDSMAGKLNEATRDVVGVIYAPAAGLGEDELEALTASFRERLQGWAGAEAAESWVI